MLLVCQVMEIAGCVGFQGGGSTFGSGCRRQSSLVILFELQSLEIGIEYVFCVSMEGELIGYAEGGFSLRCLGDSSYNQDEICSDCFLLYTHSSLIYVSHIVATARK